MNQRKTSRKHEFSLNDIQGINIRDSKEFSELDPAEYFKNQKEVGAALLQCLVENDTEAFIEILDSYLRVNRTKVATTGKIARSTVQLALSKRGNPTLKTLAKIAHEAVRR